MRARRKLALLALGSVLAGTAEVSAANPEWGWRGMVVSSVGPAAAAGREILIEGGNAIDAAVAAGFDAGVSHQFSSGLGGGGPCRPSVRLEGLEAGPHTNPGSYPSEEGLNSCA